MPGPEDKGYEIESSPVAAPDGGSPGIDSALSRDRPARGSASDLKQRQKRLPHGHPSSDFDDEGNLRPALVPLRNLELPEAGEERDQNGAGRDHAIGEVQASGSGNADNGLASGIAWADATQGGVAQGGVAQDGDPQDGDPQDGDPQDGDPDAADGEQSDSGTAADRGPAADPPGEDEAADTEIAVTTPDVWSPVAGESTASESMDPGPQSWQAVDQEQEPTDDAEVTVDPELDDAGMADEQLATENHGPITGDPASTATEAAEAKRAENLTPEQVRIAVRAHGRCRLAEGRTVFGTYSERGLTPAMRRIEDELDHGKLVPDTEKYALKSLDRFQEKLAKQVARNPDKSPEELAREIHDGVRYTFVFDEDRYYDATLQAHSELEKEGFVLEFRRNTWTDPEYKGINSRWYDSAHNAVFEVQFHTEASWEAKQSTHDAYQKISDTATSSAERDRLRDAQKEVSASVPLPPRCTEIPDYRKEGR